MQGLIPFLYEHTSVLIRLVCVAPLRFSTKKNAFYLSVNVFSTEVLIGETIFPSPAGDENAILRGHPCHAKA